MWHFMVPTFVCFVCTILHNAKGQNMGRLKLQGRAHPLPLDPTVAASDDLLTASTPVNQWFTQKLDHFNSSNTKTWQQRYFTNDAFFNNVTKSGPIFLLIGGESAIDDGFINAGMWIEWAKNYSALCFQVEHRFYGISYPTPDVSLSNLKYHNSQQALADLANFIQSMKTTMGLNLPSNKWIVFGGSYAGVLAAWMRLHYPNLVSGAIASSAPIVATANFSQYMEVVQTSLQTSKQGSACTNAIRQGTATLQTMTQSGSTACNSITNLFNLCLPLNCSDSNQVSNFFQILANNFASNIQYNNNPYWPGPNIDTLCSIMTNTSVGTPTDRLVAVNNLMLNLYGETCLYSDYYGYTQYFQATNWDDPANSGAGRQYLYQTCNELGYWQTSDSINQPFGNLFPYSFKIKESCTDIFGPSFTELRTIFGSLYTNVLNYGLAGAIKSSRIAFPQGSIDPWRAIGVTSNLSASNVVYYIQGASHCQDMYPTNSGDSPALKAAKLSIGNYVKYLVYN